MKSYYFLVFILVSVTCNAQNVIAFENFDGVTPPVLPSGWIAEPSEGWEVSSSNSSNSIGASGLNNLEIRNTDSTGIYKITTPFFSTLNRINIKLSWIARHTTGFPVPGSNVNLLEYSVDSGATWNNVPFTQNPNNSIWQSVNSSEMILLPENANNRQSLKLRLTANVFYDLNGTYRIDDFILLGDLSNSIEEINTEKPMVIFPNPANNIIHVYMNKYNNDTYLNIFDLNGKKVIQTKIFQQIEFFDIEHLTSGLYFIQLQSENIIYTEKLIKK